MPKNVNANIAGKASANAPQFVSLKSVVRRDQREDTIESIEMPPRLVLSRGIENPSCSSKIFNAEIRDYQDNNVKYERHTHEIERDN